ncbi:MAG: DUF5591 domain-containing protein [Thermoplasmatales archaeon]|nr:MAG: DUF5591 domain-containing protein [Thermoplasmatales archaeon]
MKYIINKRDGLARIGEFFIDNKRIITPNVLFVNTSRFKAPDFADLVLTNDNIKTEKPALNVLKEGSSFKEKKDNLWVFGNIFYSKDLPKEILFSNIKSHKVKSETCCIIPSNIDIIDDILKNNSASFFIVSNASQLFQQPKMFVNFIIELREKIGYEKTIYLPTIGDSTSFAVLAYMGIDFFDSISAILDARRNTFLFSNGRYGKNELNEIPCSCHYCNKFKDNSQSMEFKDILNHNYLSILNEIKQVRNSIFLCNLRELAERRAKTNPNLAAILRILDENHYNFIEKRTPIIKKSFILATTKESLSRPEIKRFQNRIIKRYKKPKSAKILLLLPCSAKKPYSFSKSHRLYIDKLHSSGNPFVIHELIITSPIGLVPRELELVYPASAYDIPVTGVWDEDEKKMIRELLTSYLDVNKYDKIVAHLPEKIMEFIVDLSENISVTCVDRPTSKESIKKLADVLKNVVEPYQKIKSQKRAMEDMSSLASYQFGTETAKKLLKDCMIAGRYPYQKIMHKNIQIGMLVKERGLISLTIKGAERLADSGKYWIEIYDDFTLKGSVFAPGVKNADESIRIGDEVIILKNKKLCAVGVAKMNGHEMKEVSYGEAVNVRHIK